MKHKTTGSRKIEPLTNRVAPLTLDLTAVMASMDASNASMGNSPTAPSSSQSHPSFAQAGPDRDHDLGGHHLAAVPRHSHPSIMTNPLGLDPSGMPSAADVDAASQAAGATPSSSVLPPSSSDSTSPQPFRRRKL